MGLDVTGTHPYHNRKDPHGRFRICQDALGPRTAGSQKDGYKYGQENLQEFLALRKQYFYQGLHLHDFDGNPMVYLDKAVQISLSAARVLLTPQQNARLYGTKAMEEEILSTF